eukprot:TRINITY_DN76812_c0_g1_i1.p1 TRINITY_DN76812_c0_g1~~TRINITY_DN76812_c0_g1_i1.p1  ORF type:complete len:235 (+),score=47.72 TRINITY_DN76812_c0_g1_i1:52-756(+)
MANARPRKSALRLPVVALGLAAFSALLLPSSLSCFCSVVEIPRLVQHDQSRCARLLRCRSAALGAGKLELSEPAGDRSEQPSQVKTSRKGALVASAVVVAALAETSAVVAEEEKKEEKEPSAGMDLMELLDKDKTPNDNGAPEKHIPTVTIKPKGVIVSVPHVMDAEKPHYIQFMYLAEPETGKLLAVKRFKPDDPSPPQLIARAPEGTYVAGLYCNLHGRWEGEPFKVPASTV